MSLNSSSIHLNSMILNNAYASEFVSQSVLFTQLLRDNQPAAVFYS